MNVTELEQYLSQSNIHPDAYSISTGIPGVEDRYCLVEEDGMWTAYYADRGQRVDQRKYRDENSACWGFLDLLKSDESVWLKK